MDTGKVSKLVLNLREQFNDPNDFEHHINSAKKRSQTTIRMFLAPYMNLRMDIHYALEIDDIKAFEYYSKSAEKGYVNAQNNLVLLYKNNEGIQKKQFIGSKKQQRIVISQYNIILVKVTGWE